MGQTYFLSLLVSGVNIFSQQLHPKYQLVPRHDHSVIRAFSHQLTGGFEDLILHMHGFEDVDNKTRSTIGVQLMS